MLRAVLSPPSPFRALALLASGLVLALAVVAYELGITIALALVPRRSVLGSTAVRRVSVLVAAWNEAAVIGKAVRGLLAQDGVELEVIVADDGSTDGTAAAVPDDPRV